MSLAAKIVCKSAGTIGMGVALYEASRVSSYFAKTESEDIQSKYLENAMYNARTIDKISYTSNNIREKTFDLRTRNPFPAIYGSVKGALGGFFYGLGTSLPVIACSAIALLGKNRLAKLGTAGLGIGFIYKILRDGYGIGKKNPMN